MKFTTEVRQFTELTTGQVGWFCCCKSVTSSSLTLKKYGLFKEFTSKPCKRSVRKAKREFRRFPKIESALKAE